MHRLLTNFINKMYIEGGFFWLYLVFLVGRRREILKILFSVKKKMGNGMNIVMQLAGDIYDDNIN